MEEYRIFTIIAETKDKVYRFDLWEKNYPNALRQCDELIDFIMGITNVDPRQDNLVAVIAKDK